MVALLAGLLLSASAQPNATEPAVAAPTEVGPTPAAPEAPSETNSTGPPIGLASLPPFFALRSCVPYNVLLLPGEGSRATGRAGNRAARSVLPS